MAIREADVVEGQARLEIMRSEFRAARQRRLIKRGIALWNHSEAACLAAPAQTMPSANDESE